MNKRAFQSYVSEMRIFLMFNKVKLWPNNNSARYKDCPGRPGIKRKRAKRKMAKQSRQLNYRKG